MSSLIHRFVLGVDIKGYSSRDTRRMQELQADLHRVLDEAATATQFNRDTWERLPEGDGEFAVIPPDADLSAMAGRFVSELDERLRIRNSDHTEEMGLRLRVAIDSGTLVPSAFGYAGDALVGLSRLLDSEEVRAPLDNSMNTNLALIVSDPVFRQVVDSGFGGLRPDQFAPVDVSIPAKGYAAVAHIWTSGPRPDPRAVAGADQAADTPPPGPEPVRAAEVSIGEGFTVHGGFHGDIFGGNKTVRSDRE